MPFNINTFVRVVETPLQEMYALHCLHTRPNGELDCMVCLLPNYILRKQRSDCVLVDRLESLPQIVSQEPD